MVLVETQERTVLCAGADRGGSKYRTVCGGVYGVICNCEHQRTKCVGVERVLPHHDPGIHAVSQHAPDKLGCCLVLALQSFNLRTLASILC
jgi:hypothetical protein